MIKWSDAIKKALNAHYHDSEYAYFYGAKGQILTDEVMESLWNAEPNYFARYNADQKKYIFDYSRNRIGYDCSGFIGALVDDMSYSGQQISNCSAITTPKDGVAGSLLWKPGHIGIDIGYGYFIHMPEEGRSVCIGKISEYDWKQSGRHKNVDYTGATNL